MIVKFDLEPFVFRAARMCEQFSPRIRSKITFFSDE